MERVYLNGNWNGECIANDGNQDFAFEATVPGCVHTDLLGKQIPDDIYYRDNADKCQWIEDRDWKYTRNFNLDYVPEKAKLVFEGLDTYADIYLNGELLGSVDNMFIKHTFDAKSALRTGENTISVLFHSPIRAVDGLELRDAAFTCERVHTRRMQCTYGWDWVARFITCGIWRDVYLDFSNGFSVRNAYIYTEALYGNSAQVVIEAELENYCDGGMLDIVINNPNGQVIYNHRFFCKEQSFKGYIDIPNAQLWYPHGYGEQPLYTIKIGDKTYPFGIRTVIIEQLPDEKNSEYYKKCLEIKDSESGRIYDFNEDFSGFRLLINGLPIMCKGANWVPCEPFPSAETDKKISTLLSLAKEANVNMLRVWGGGIFEKPHFYNECDRLGILVTQDFLMACGNYPEEKEEFILELRKETEFAAYALRNHPSLVWWSGDNENAVLGCDEYEHYHGRTAIHNGIMPVLERLDPKRRFLLSSPYGGKLYASKTVGTTHNTQYLGDSFFPYILKEKMDNYKEYFSTFLARFIAEEPTFGAISLPSLKKFMAEEDIYDSEEMWEYHMKGNPALPYTLFEVLKNFAEKVLGAFTDGADRYFKLKYSQFEWVRVSLENVRRNYGFINGIIYWMWNDCWPASAGWSVVDYYCLPKASFYSFKRCAGEVIVSADCKEKYEIYLCNDGLSQREVELSISYIKDGCLFPVSKHSTVIEPQTSRNVYGMPLDNIPEDSVLICDANFKGGHDRTFYRKGNLPLAKCESPKIIKQDNNSITLSADRYIHVVELEGECVFDDNYFSLLPGEERTIFFRTTDNAESADFTVLGYTL